MRISDLLNEQLISVSLGQTDKQGVIEKLVDLAMASGKISDKGIVLQSILEREKLMSTGLERGVAVPHAKTSAVSGLVMSLAISKEGIDFQSVDGKPSHLFFLLLAPTAAAALNIKALAQIARLTGNAKFCEAIKSAPSPQSVLELIRQAEK
jgi:fructose-specific phosphotransferase system IIA component